MFAHRFRERAEDDASFLQFCLEGRDYGNTVENRINRNLRIDEKSWSLEFPPLKARTDLKPAAAESKLPKDVVKEVRSALRRAKTLLKVDKSSRPDKQVAAIMACQIIFLTSMAAIGWWQSFGWAYYAGLGISCGLIGHQYTLIRERITDKCFRAFLDNNYVGLAIFAGIVLDQFLRTPAWLR